MKISQQLVLIIFLVTAFGCTNESTSTKDSATNSISSSVSGKMKKMLPNEITIDDTTTEIQQDETGKKVLYWKDPMVNGRRFSQPGPSPFMDMQLVPHYAEDEEDGAKP
jgi:hypothetical protein